MSLVQAQELLTSVKKLLQYHQQIGIPGYRGNTILTDFLRKPHPSKEVSPEHVKKTLVLSGEKKKVVQRPVETTVEHVSVSVDDIRGDVQVCTACELRQNRVFPVAGKGGGKKIRLLVVGDWCRVNQTDPASDQIMGRDEDQMLLRMMQAIKLGPEHYFISNVIKCALQKEKQPKAEHATTCFSYLQRQIAALQPEMICSMGLISTKTLLKSSTPLSRLRGRFHTYETEQGKKIPVLATYHPNYLLQNPEMKQATWADLQFLARHMGLLK